MNDLERFFYDDPHRCIHKWKHYFEIYERHFARFRNKAVTVVEIGVYKGGSMQMWKHYFGPQARIVGVDINPECASCAEPQVEIVIGSQEDRGFLRSLAERLGPIDILIDDGGHRPSQQIATFEELFPHVAADGVYLCEDLHTNYWGEFGGSYRAPDTFIEYCKNFIDQIHAWHAREPAKPRWYERLFRPAPPRLTISNLTRSAHSLSFYESVLVIEKRAVARPTEVVIGSNCDPPHNQKIT